MRGIFRSISLLAVGTLVLLVGGCTARRPANFYLLSSLPRAEQAGPATGPALAVGPIVLPDYLDRPQIVTRATENTLRLAELDRWAEPLSENFGRALAENLAILLDTDRILVLPGAGLKQFDYYIAIEVLRFDVTPEGECTLVTRWAVAEERETVALVVKTSTVVETAGTTDNTAGTAPGGDSAGGPPYEAAVAAMSRAVEALSREIAAAVPSAG